MEGSGAILAVQVGMAPTALDGTPEGLAGAVAPESRPGIQAVGTAIIGGRAIAGAGTGTAPEYSVPVGRCGPMPICGFAATKFRRNERKAGGSMARSGDFYRDPIE